RSPPRRTPQTPGSPPPTTATTRSRCGHDWPPPAAAQRAAAAPSAAEPAEPAAVARFVEARPAEAPSARVDLKALEAVRLRARQAPRCKQARTNTTTSRPPLLIEGTPG